MPHFAILPAGLGALALAACGVAGAATLQGRTPPADPATLTRAAAAPLACALVLRESAGSVAVAGHLTATVAAEGSYALRISQQSAGGSSQIVQGGDFVARPGEPVTLGEASFTGRAADLTATLTIETGGQTYDCPLAAG